MTDWSAWFRENPLVAAIAIVFGGPIAIGALSVLLVPVFILAEANAVLGFFAFFLLLVTSGFGIQQLRSDDSESTDTVDPVTELEQQYVRGELDDAEFERRLEKIVETEAEIDRASSTNHDARSREVGAERQ
ncbi:SHOCT domain-containing protein [Halohasta salina]|uniref:SHOCT domain-containing protein n=1 Tax=Halohasta salina TaxID=2961621 RepID=UPI0020A25EE5|nr:SHOCT domain-containing protein [Halohasta salina]